MTGFSTILVHLNHEPRVPHLIAAAAALARPSKSHVIGLYVMPPIIVPADAGIPVYSGDLVQQQIETHRAQAERVRTMFESRTKGDTFVSEWRVRDDTGSSLSIADRVVEEAHAVDLVIASQCQSADGSFALSTVPERLALGSGRPVLVLPDNWDGEVFGTNVAIAWNGRSESARATFDAMPLLRRAGKVRLLTVVSDKEYGSGKTLPGGEIAATLARQGLNVEVQTVDRYSADTGDMLLAHVASEGANLLVMGAYGHSRLREFILGGVTRHVLKNMTVPVLMSH